MIGALTPYLEQGRIRIFTINGVQSDALNNKGAHPFHRSWMQAQYDDDVASEVSRSSTPSARRAVSRLPRWALRPAPFTR